MAQERTIKSPLPGVFYRRPNPESEPYVKEGDRIEAGTTIGLVGVMKSFHEIKADSGGVVVRFLVENEEPIRVGQDLLVLGD
ncbi:acetyl-CoA carboxylase [Sphaerobacter sp.]|uniref:acetyl-CoA carboxylase n=1 Tax=Sphaerobacter sp. TaxID=2099654 RepID=UPI001DACCE8B|nr:acetyl-CoA carboxylase [Sphaerobacter sp.]MBX5445717.1 biotin carboxyl carrier domain-containing protein [Sphaerobacter sp.]